MRSVCESGFRWANRAAMEIIVEVALESESWGQNSRPMSHTSHTSFRL
jgi:hypothetical protein